MNNKILPSNSKLIFEPHLFPKNELPFIFHHNNLTSDGPRNIHENIELLYFLEGHGYVKYDDELLSVHPGDVVVVNSFTAHQVIPEKEICFLCLIVENAFCKANQMDSTSILFSQVIHDISLNRLFEIVEQEFDTPQVYQHTGIRTAVLNLLLYLCRNHSEKKDLLTPFSEISYHYVHLATDYIKENLSKKLTVDEIAASAGLSKYYFLRQFKKVTGYTVIEYVNIIRCEYAMELLRSEQYKIKEIAFLCGFDNFSYFTNVFKKYTGLLPSEINKGLR